MDIRRVTRMGVVDCVGYERIGGDVLFSILSNL